MAPDESPTLCQEIPTGTDSKMNWNRARSRTAESCACFKAVMSCINHMKPAPEPSFSSSGLTSTSAHQRRPETEVLMSSP
jgi:hypothetical protein